MEISAIQALVEFNNFKWLAPCFLN